MNPSSTSEKPTKSEVSAEQKETFVKLVESGARKMAGAIIDELSLSGVITVANLQRVLKRGDEIVAVINEAVRAKVAEIAENIVDRVKLISGAVVLDIEETNGSETIGGAKHVFTGYLDDAFKKKKCNPAPKTRVQVYEMIKNGTYAQIFGGMSDDLNKLCMTEHQIKRFVQTHRKWLRDEGYGTFFLYKEGDDFFVAFVYLHSDGPLVCRGPLSRDFVWRADDRRRFVVPQLALEN